MTIYLRLWDPLQDAALTPILSATISQGSFYIPVQNVPAGIWNAEYFVARSVDDELCRAPAEDYAFRQRLTFERDGDYFLGYAVGGTASDACEHFPH